MKQANGKHSSKLSLRVGFLSILFVAIISLLPSAASEMVSNLGMVAVGRCFMTKSLDQILTSQSSINCPDNVSLLLSGVNSEASIRGRGLALLALGRPEDAINYLRRANTDKRDIIAVYWLGVSYDFSGNHQKAIEAWMPVNFQAKAFERADALLKDGLLDQSRSEYEIILTVSPQNVRALIGLGRIAIYRQDWGEADRLLTRALEISPKNIEVLVELGRARYFGQQGEEEAIAFMQRAIQIDPKCDWCYLVLADTYIIQEQYIEAVSVLEEAEFRTTMSDALVYRKLAQVYLEDLMRANDARDTCKRGLKQYPSDAYLYYWLGLAERQLGNELAAQYALERAIQLAPGVVEFYSAIDYK